MKARRLLDEVTVAVTLVGFIEKTTLAINALLREKILKMINYGRKNMKSLLFYCQ